MASHSADKAFRFSVGQLMVAVAIVGFLAAGLSPLISDTRVGLLTALLAHAVGIGLGAGVYLIALAHDRRGREGHAGRVLWRVPIVMHDLLPQRHDPFLVSVVVSLAMAVGSEILMLSVILNREVNGTSIAGIGGLSAGILTALALTQRRFPPPTLLIGEHGVVVSSYLIPWSQLAIKPPSQDVITLQMLVLPRWSWELLPPREIAADVAAYLAARCQPWPGDSTTLGIDSPRIPAPTSHRSS